MARPSVHPFTDQLYGRLEEFRREADEQLDYPLLRYLSLLGDQGGAVADLLDRIDHYPGEEQPPGTSPRPAALPERINRAHNPAAETAAGVVELERNLHPNPDPASLTGYGAGGNGTLSLETDAVLGRFARWTATTAYTSGQNTGINLGTNPATAGTVYSAAVTTRTSRATRLSFYVQFLDSAGANIGNHTAQLVPAVGEAVRLEVLNRTAPAGTVNVRLLMYGISGEGDVGWAIGDTLDASNVMLNTGVTAHPYFDGDTPDAGDFTYAWLGTPHASASRITAPGSPGWNSNDGSVYPAYRTTVDPISGAASFVARRRNSAAAAGAAASVWANGIGALGALKVAPGQLVRASLAVRTDEAARTVAADFAFRDSAFAVTGSSTRTVLNLDPGVTTRIEVPATAAPAGTDSVILIARVLSADGSAIPIGELTYFGELLIELDPPADEAGYFDGDTPDVASPYGDLYDELYEWTGTAHASTSRRRARPAYVDTSDLVDPATADAEWLPWLAQLVGAVLPRGIAVAEQRVTIASAAGGFLAGTPGALAAVARRALTGTQYLTITRHLDDNVWVIGLAVAEEDTPSIAAVVAAIEDAGAKPAGYRLEVTFYVITWDTLEATYGTWDELDAVASWAELEQTRAPATV